jgi:AcrR family transcriptional regulator
MSQAPPSRRDRRRALTREALLASAAQLFAEYGVEGTTVAQIADGADVGYGSFYNYFDGLEAVAEVLATDSVADILIATEAIMSKVRDPRLLPCVGARVILRSFLHDAVVRWMIQSPLLFTETFQQQAQPFMEQYETPGIASGALKPPVDHATWIRTLPWILLSELRCAVMDSADHRLKHEESFARICLRLLGVDDADADDLLVESLRLVDDAIPNLPLASNHRAITANPS